MAAGDRAPTVVLGYVARAHGVRGEVRLKLHNPESNTLADLEEVILRPRDGGAPRPWRVHRVRGTPQAPILTLEGVGDRAAAEALCGAEVTVPREVLPDTAEDEWYVVDLIGAQVRDEGGRVVGEVEDVISYPSIDCLRVRCPDGVREVPMVEPWLVAVDASLGEVHVGSLADVPLQER